MRVGGVHGEGLDVGVVVADQPVVLLLQLAELHGKDIAKGFVGVHRRQWSRVGRRVVLEVVEQIRTHGEREAAHGHAPLGAGDSDQIVPFTVPVPQVVRAGLAVHVVQARRERELRGFRGEAVFQLPGQHLAVHVEAAVGQVEGPGRGRQVPLAKLPVVTARDAGGRHILVPEEFVLLPEGRRVAAGPGAQTALLELHEVAVGHEVEGIGAAVVRRKRKMGRLLAAAVARPAADTKGPFVRDRIAEPGPGADPRPMTVVPRHAGGGLRIPIDLVAHAQIAVEGQVRIVVDPVQPRGRMDPVRREEKQDREERNTGGLSAGTACRHDQWGYGLVHLGFCSHLK